MRSVYDPFTLDITCTIFSNVSLAIISYHFLQSCLDCGNILHKCFYHGASSNLINSKYSIYHHHALLERIVFLESPHNLYLIFSEDL